MKNRPCGHSIPRLLLTSGIGLEKPNWDSDRHPLPGRLFPNSECAAIRPPVPALCREATGIRPLAASLSTVSGRIALNIFARSSAVRTSSRPLSMDSIKTVYLLQPQIQPLQISVFASQLQIVTRAPGQSPTPTIPPAPLPRGQACGNKRNGRNACEPCGFTAIHVLMSFCQTCYRS